MRRCIRAAGVAVFLLGLTGAAAAAGAGFASVFGAAAMAVLNFWITASVMSTPGSA